MSKQGKITPWAPQGHVLGHDSVGFFVMLCGYNSVIEKVANGVPMIFRPLFADNFMNGKMIENVWKIGAKVEGGVMTKSGLVKALEMVFPDDQNHGNKMKERALKLKQIVTEAAGPNGNAHQISRLWCL